jgi:hypothetical protein
MKNASIAIATLATVLTLSGPAFAKEYNNEEGIPADSQALINRVQADIAHRGADEGFYGSFEDDCSSLNIGNNSSANEQVIVADTIINIGGRCRVVRSQQGFQKKDKERRDEVRSENSDFVKSDDFQKADRSEPVKELFE